MAMVSCLCFAESSSHWEQSLRTCVHGRYTRTQKKWKVLTYRGVLSAGGMIYSTRQIEIFMCKGETNETTCDRYTKRNNR